MNLATSIGATGEWLGGISADHSRSKERELREWSLPIGFFCFISKTRSKNHGRGGFGLDRSGQGPWNQGLAIEVRPGRATGRAVANPERG